VGGILVAGRGDLPGQPEQEGDATPLDGGQQHSVTEDEAAQPGARGEDDTTHAQGGAE
jgi:hypothetical protein